MDLKNEITSALASLLLLLCSSTCLGAEFGTALDRDSIRAAHQSHWKKGGSPECRTLLAFKRWLWGLQAPKSRVLQKPERTGQIQPQFLPAPYALKSKSQSTRRENRGKMFQLEGQAEGMLLNGKQFSDFNLVWLPKAKVPVAVLNPSGPVRGRIILLHGLGYSISNVYSVTSTGITLKQIANGGEGNPFATWFASTFPELQLAFQIVLVDLPPMGWAPSLAELPTAVAMAEHLKQVVGDLDSLEPLLNFFVSRSASAPLSILAAEKQAGVVITGGTFPHKQVLAANLKEIRRLEKEDGETPDWLLIDELTKRFKDRSFTEALNAVAATSLPIRSIIGDDDAETPWDAQVRWANLLGISEDLFIRSQHVIPGAAHQVFRRPGVLPLSTFSSLDPDVQAFHALLDFLRFWTEEKR